MAFTDEIFLRSFIPQPRPSPGPKSTLHTSRLNGSKWNGTNKDPIRRGVNKKMHNLLTKKIADSNLRIFDLAKKEKYR